MVGLVLVDVTTFVKVPLGADHVPEAAFPVRVPTTVNEFPAHIDAVDDDTVTPLKLFTFITSFLAPFEPQGLNASTVTSCLLPIKAFVPTDTVMLLDPSPPVIVKPCGKSHL